VLLLLEVLSITLLRRRASNLTYYFASKADDSSIPAGLRRILKSPHFLASKADPGSHPAPFIS